MKLGDYQTGPFFLTNSSPYKCNNAVQIEWYIAMSVIRKTNIRKSWDGDRVLSPLLGKGVPCFHCLVQGNFAPNLRFQLNTSFTGPHLVLPEVQAPMWWYHLGVMSLYWEHRVVMLQGFLAKLYGLKSYLPIKSCSQMRAFPLNIPNVMMSLVIDIFTPGPALLVW